VNIVRRVLLTLICLLGGQPTAQAAEPRIAALSWEPVEHLLKLGVEPVAVADADDYRAWVVRPKLPTSAIDVGTRTEPNLELLAQLNLDLILITPLLEDLRPKLERIAPVVSFGDFTQERDNLVMQRDNYLELAHLLGRTARAQAQLTAMEAHIAEMRGRLLAHFGGELPALSVVRFTSPTTVLVFGPNSMP